MSFRVHSLALVTLLMVPSLPALAQGTPVASRHAYASATPLSVDPPTRSPRDGGAFALELPRAYAGPRTSRTEALMEHWDVALRVSTWRACFRGETDPAASMLNMINLAVQSETVPAAEREAVTSAIYRAFYDVANHGGCAGLTSPPFQLFVTGIDGAMWGSPPPSPLLRHEVMGDTTGRIVGTVQSATAWGMPVMRRGVYDGAAGAERLVGFEDVMATSTRKCVEDMTRLAAAIGSAHPEMPTRHTFHSARASTGEGDHAACEAFADASAGPSWWTIDFVNPTTGLLEVGLRLRRAPQGGLEVVANYPGVGYQ